jgi:hypothetical protein
MFVPDLLHARAAPHKKAHQVCACLLSAGLKMGKQRKYLVLAPLAASTASGTQLQQPQPTPECIAGLGGVGRWNMAYFGYYPPFSVLTGEVRHGLELTKND